MNWIDKKEELDRLINVEHKSYEEIGRIYGCSGNNVKKSAQRIGICLPSRRKINECETFNNRPRTTSVCKNCGKVFPKYPSSNGMFCSCKCASEYKRLEHYKKIINGDESIMKASYSPSKYRDYYIKEQGGVCAICGCKPEHNGKELIFIVDHIDGNAANNKRDNLRAICPNCDSQLDTYKSKNKNGARHYYRYHKEKKE